MQDQNQSARADNSPINRTLAAVEKLRQEQPSILALAEIVGCWIWIDFPSKPSTEIRDWLKANGYRWNSRRSVWQNPCGYNRPRSSAGTMQLRIQYGARSLAALREDEVAA
jgi:hypothetical protein